MTGVPGKHVMVGRVLHEDGDFITMEIAKRDDISYHLQQDEETLETVGGDKFLTLIFVHNVSPQGHKAVLETWHPWDVT